MPLSLQVFKTSPVGLTQHFLGFYVEDRAVITLVIKHRRALRHVFESVYVKLAVV